MCEDLFHTSIAYCVLPSFFLSLCLSEKASVQPMPERKPTRRKMRARDILRERAMPKNTRPYKVSIDERKPTNYLPPRTAMSPILQNFTKTNERQAFDTISTNGTAACYCVEKNLRE